MNKICRPHPIQAFENMLRFIFLLIIPLIRGLFLAFTGGIVLWLQGAWFDIIILLLIITLGLLRYRTTYFIPSEKEIIMHSGIIKKNKIIIPYENIVACGTIAKYYLRPLDAAVLYLDTLAGSSRNWDFKLIVKNEDIENVISKISHDSRNRDFIYKSNFLYIFLFSLISSNSFVGIVVITTLISGAGEILGERINNIIVGTFQNIVNFIAFGIPTVAVAFAYLMFFGWFVAFMANIIRYKNLNVERKGRNLKINGGFLTLRQYVINEGSINYLDIRQSFFTSLLGIYSVSLDAIGYKKERHGMSVIIPTISKKRLMPMVKKLLPDFIISKRQIKPNFGAIIRFTLDPLYPCLLIPLISILLMLLYPVWSELIFFIALMAMIPSVWFLAVRIIDWLTSGISYEKGFYTIRYSKGYYLHTLILSKKRLMSVQIRQSVIQKFSNRCDVFIYSYNETRTRHRLRNLDRDEIEKFFEIT